MAQNQSADLRGVARHARLRWAGAPLLITGLSVVGLCVATWLMQGSGGYLVFLGLFGTGLGLAAFGANHEATMALALQVKEKGEAELPENLAAELVQELQRDRDGTIALRAFPKTAMALPLVAVAIQATTAWLVLTS